MRSGRGPTIFHSRAGELDQAVVRDDDRDLGDVVELGVEPPNSQSMNAKTKSDKRGPSGGRLWAQLTRRRKGVALPTGIEPVSEP